MTASLSIKSIEEIELIKDLCRKKNQLQELLMYTLAINTGLGVLELLNLKVKDGFNKPCIIHKIFADIYEFNEKNSIIYECNDKLQEAMQNAINMSNEKYKILKADLSHLERSIDEKSFKNMKRLLSE